MKINWKLRLQNKTTLLALIGAIVALVYQVLGIFEIVPAVSEDSVISATAVIINLLVALGVVVDPTTSGVSDSTRALCYECPKEDD
ncbi:MAG: phage holin [Lachnospiraceae bacterium]|nr:phage holin [Bacillota bacterium]MDD7078270.1 phage holin [Lachnospiraceae bacterium]